MAPKIYNCKIRGFYGCEYENNFGFATPCSLVEIYQRFGGTLCNHFRLEEKYEQ
jgi:hypothetical protein